VPPATSKCETACAESNPWLIHENPADISRRKHNCIYDSDLNFFLPFMILNFVFSLQLGFLSLEEKVPVARVDFML